MLSENQKKFFEENGFLLIRNILPEIKVKQLRSVLLEVFSKTSNEAGDFDNSTFFKGGSLRRQGRVKSRKSSLRRTKKTGNCQGSGNGYETSFTG